MTGRPNVSTPRIGSSKATPRTLATSAAEAYGSARWSARNACKVRTPNSSRAKASRASR
jgi:hypothetical protein